MKIAIEGCAHGELEKIYDTLTYLEQKDNVKIDLLLCCGDFQSTRNMDDLRCMAIPPKYLDICTFYKYYSGEKVAPVLTLFIGGNHEASNYLQELAYGGWVAPNIYYMGYASVVNFGGVRIAGISGIYKGHDYMKGHFEKPPYSGDTLRSAYHVRNVEIFRLKQVKEPIDIIMSHDWPRGVYNYGNVEELLRRKPFFRGDIEANALGSKPCEELLHHLKPAYWFAAHLHCKFAALIAHDSEEGDEGKLTKFLALDKCLPKRQFLQIVDVPHDDKKPLELEYDLEWLTILHFTNHLLSVKKNMQYMPGPGHQSRWIFTPTKEEMEMIGSKFKNDLRIPSNFTQTATSYDPNEYGASSNVPEACLNPQTMSFCERLGVDDPMALLMGCVNVSSADLSGVNDTLPSFLTPDKPEVSFASSQDGPARRMNMTLPSPKNESLDSVVNTSLESGLAELSPPSKTGLPSPIGCGGAPDEVAQRSSRLSRISLVLPSPNNTCDVTDSDIGKEGNQNLAEVEICAEKLEGTNTDDDGVVEVIDRTDNDAGADAPDNGTVVSVDPQPQIKRFKRRNQALYTDTNDE